VHTLAEAAPTAVLGVYCGVAGWKEDLGTAGAYFGSQPARTLSGIVCGYAALITVFIVQDMQDTIGCSLGPVVNHVTVAPADLRRPRTLAHGGGKLDHLIILLPNQVPIDWTGKHRLKVRIGVLLTGEPTVICVHRPVLPHILDALELAPTTLVTGEFLVAHLSFDGEVHTLKRHQPQAWAAAGSRDLEAHSVALIGPASTQLREEAARALIPGLR
jgi:hypothetical protein